MDLSIYAPQICACLGLDQEQFVPVIELVLEGCTCSQIAQAFDIHEDIMKGWLKELREESKRFSGRSLSSRATVREAVLEALIMQLVIEA